MQVHGNCSRHVSILLTINLLLISALVGELQWRCTKGVEIKQPQEDQVRKQSEQKNKLVRDASRHAAPTPERQPDHDRAEFRVKYMGGGAKRLAHKHNGGNKKAKGVQ